MPPVRFPDFGIGPREAVIELEPEATDSSVARTIAALVQVHLHGNPLEAIDDFCSHSLLPVVAGLMVSTVGPDRACELFAEMPKFVRDAERFDNAMPAGPAH